MAGGIDTLQQEELYVGCGHRLRHASRLGRLSAVKSSNAKGSCPRAVRRPGKLSRSSSRSRRTEEIETLMSLPFACLDQA